MFPKIVWEPFLGSAGILVASAVTIPLVGFLVGAHISSTQGLQMGVVFFALRFIWLLFLRYIFSRSER